MEERVKRLDGCHCSDGLFEVVECCLAIQCPEEGNLFREKVGERDGTMSVIRNEVLKIAHMTKKDFNVRFIKIFFISVMSISICIYLYGIWLIDRLIIKHHRSSLTHSLSSPFTVRPTAVPQHDASPSECSTMRQLFIPKGLVSIRALSCIRSNQKYVSISLFDSSHVNLGQLNDELTLNSSYSLTRDATV